MGELMNGKLSLSTSPAAPFRRRQSLRTRSSRSGASTKSLRTKSGRRTTGSHRTSSTELSDEEEEDDDQSRPSSAGRLLVVDDSVMVQKMLVASLTRLNFEVETAKNGSEGLEKMKRSKEPYLAVLMDFLMPVLDGITATAMFRDWERSVLIDKEKLEIEKGTLEQAAGAELEPSGAPVSEGNGSPNAAGDDSASDGGYFTPHSAARNRREETSPELHLRYTRQYVIGISANAESSDLEAAKVAGVDKFLSKPVKVAQVVEIIDGLKSERQAC